MTETGFVEGQSDNLPKIDVFMMSCFYASNPDYISSEFKGVKSARSQRESYGDSAIGYVQVKRDGDLCVVKAKVTPEHNVRQKYYNVTATCNEAQETVLSVQCEDCTAHSGGCKHAVAFLAWLHRRSEEPSTTSIQCYWKKPKLSTVGTSLKLITAKDMHSANASKIQVAPDSSNEKCFLTEIKKCCVEVGDTENQLMKYFREPSMSEKLSINFMVVTIASKPSNPEDFIQYCKGIMTARACEEAEQATRNQSDSPLWHELRYARITASKAYEAAHCRVLDGTLTEAIIGATKLKDTEAMKRGRLLEKKVIEVVEGILKIKIHNCGIRLNSEYPVLGASPDGESDEFIVEVKCPSNKKAFSKYITTQETHTSSAYRREVTIWIFVGTPITSSQGARRDLVERNSQQHPKVRSLEYRLQPAYVSLIPSSQRFREFNLFGIFPMRSLKYHNGIFTQNRYENIQFKYPVPIPPFL